MYLNLSLSVPPLIILFLVAKLLYNSKCPSVCYKQYWKKVIFSAAIQDSWLFFLRRFVWPMSSYSIILLSVCLFVMSWMVFEFPYSWFFVSFIKFLYIELIFHRAWPATFGRSRPCYFFIKFHQKMLPPQNFI